LVVLGPHLATEVLPVQLGQRVWDQGKRASRGGMQRARQIAQKRPRRRTTDVDDGVQLPGEEETAAEHPAIRIRGKQLDDGPPMVVPALSTDLPEESADEHGNTGSASNSLTSRVAGALGWGDRRSEEEAGEEQAGEDEAQSDASRTLEVDGETRLVREDEAHKTRELKIRTPDKQKAPPEGLDEAIQETPQADVDDYMLPAVDLLIESDDICYDEQAKEVRRKAVILEQTFRNFGFNIRVVEIETGPVIAQYEVELEAGLRLSKITGLADDLAIALRVPSVRIVAPIPGKNTVGIEVPNETRQVVRLRDVIEECGAAARKMKIPIFLGKDVSGNALAVDLASMPHLLIAGRTGTGKSVCLNAIISSILMTRRPDEVRMLMIDPKMVELSGYGRLPHLMHPVVTDMKKAEAILGWAVDKMEERYSLLAQVGVRHISSYNSLGREELARRMGAEGPEEEANLVDHLPFIVIVADEMADLMMVAGKEVEQHIIRLAQKSRAVGIHLILATQKPTVDVITGLIKSNLPARISFQVASRTDSRVVLDENGADKLLGNGDMLFLWPGTSMLLRGQGTFLSDDEIQRVCDHCSHGEQNFVGELMNLKVTEEQDEEVGSGGTANFRRRDELYESAVDVVVREGRGSCSLLQRALGIGYGRAARLIDFMAEDGIVGQYNGSQAREVLMSVSEWETMQGLDPSESEEEDTPEATAPGESPVKRNTIRRGDGWEDDAEEEWEDVEEESPVDH
jgi:S-DNA-T family DNA segregation ATPase FtsK/SpoIIIE